MLFWPRQDNAKHTHLLQILSKHSFSIYIRQAWVFCCVCANSGRWSDPGWNGECACVIAALSLNSSLMAAGQSIHLSLQLIFSVMVLCNKHLRLKSIWRNRSTQLRLLTVAELIFPLKQQIIETQLHLYPRSILKCHVHYGCCVSLSHTDWKY